MKLSVKWLAGLAVLALAVVAVVGSTSATKAATGSIFVANEWSNRTNESPAPTGYTTTGTVYATYPGTGRIIETDADLIKVIVVDPDANETVDETVLAANLIVTGVGAGTGAQINGAIADTAVIELDGQAADQIAGDLAAVKANTSILATGSNELNGSELEIVSFFAGDGTNDPWIQVQVKVAGTYDLVSVTYETSDADQVTVTVRSELEATGVTIQADETSLSSGRFEGFVRLVPSTVTASAGSTGAGSANAGTIRTSVGPITVEFTDEGENVKRTSTVVVDTSAPTVAITGPANGSATQSRTPTFSGSVSETGSGLDISSVTVTYDSNDDATNTGPVIDTSNGTLNTGASVLGVSTTGSLDGDLSFSFSQAPAVGSELPNPGVTDVDHIVDWAVIASDLAGNKGISDVNASTAGVQLPSVNIDQEIPQFTPTASDHKTGVALSPTGEIANNRSIRVAFGDQVQNIQASDFVVELDSGATVVPTSVTIDNDPAGTGTTGLSTAVESVVYLGFSVDIASDEKPRIDLQDTIQDLAGNATATGTVTNASDGIKPTITVTLSNGSGTGSGDEGPESLTNDEIRIDIASDEALSNVPTVNVYLSDTTGTPLDTAVAALSQGVNVWRATYAKPGSAATGDRAVVVTAVDSAGNSQTSGAVATKSFRLDVSLPDPVLTIGGGTTTTSQLRPVINIDFGAADETATVTVNSIELDGTDVTSDLIASSNGTRFFIAPSSDLSMGDHEIVIPVGEASDAAGNENISAITLEFEVIERQTFNIELFAGWNAISFPSDPVDTDINAVFTNAGHDAILGWDPSVPGMWRIATRDAVSGQLTTTAENGLNSVSSTQAYWAHSDNFEPVEVLLVGEASPDGGQPPEIPQILTVAGFNAIPVVDPSRKQTTGPAGVNLNRTLPGGTTSAVTVDEYLGGVTYGRVVIYDPQTLNYITLSPNTVVTTGEVLFVEIIPNEAGATPPIFP